MSAVGLDWIRVQSLSFIMWFIISPKSLIFSSNKTLKQKHDYVRIEQITSVKTILKRCLARAQLKVKQRRPGGSVSLSHAVKIPTGTESSRLITRLILVNLTQKLRARSSERSWSEGGLQTSRGGAVAKSHSSNHSPFIPLPLDGDYLACDVPLASLSAFLLLFTSHFNFASPLFFPPCSYVLNIVLDLISLRLTGVELCTNPRGFVLSLRCFFLH